jgi:hypothetical protein
MVRYSTVQMGERCKVAMDGRAFDDSTIKAKYITQSDFEKGLFGHWFQQAPPPPPQPQWW